MEANIIRGSNQIGGSIIEVVAGDTRIALDVGAELDEDVPAVPEVEGLFSGTPMFDAVLISHYHRDHLGLLDYVLPQIPVYMGEGAWKVYSASNGYMDKPVRDVQGYLAPGKTFTIGNIEITPFLCDHSAFDSCMVLLAHNSESVLYTGDFRSNGRKSFDKLLRCLPSHVDTLICEGTTAGSSTHSAITEAELEEIAVGRLRKVGNAPAFACMASTNIDRIVTMYRAAKRTGRLLLQDVYTATITSAIGGTIPNPDYKDVCVFLTNPKQHDGLKRFGDAKIGRKGIVHERFVMMVRPSMLPYLERLNEEVSLKGGILFYSMWNGYRRKPDMGHFLDRVRSLGLDVVDLHGSGHADAEAIGRLVEAVSPTRILPVHTEHAEWFERFG